MGQSQDQLLKHLFLLFKPTRVTQRALQKLIVLCYHCRTRPSLSSEILLCFYPRFSALLASCLDDQGATRFRRKETDKPDVKL